MQYYHQLKETMEGNTHKDDHARGLFSGDAGHHLYDNRLFLAAHEINENISQILSFVKLHISDSLEHHSAEAIKTQLEDLPDMIGKVIRELRGISSMLNTVLIRRMGLAEALRLEMGQPVVGMPHLDMQIKGMPFPLPAEKELSIYQAARGIFSILAVNTPEANDNNASLHMTLAYEGTRCVIAIEPRWPLLPSFQEINQQLLKEIQEVLFLVDGELSISFPENNLPLIVISVSS